MEEGGLLICSVLLYLHHSPNIPHRSNSMDLEHWEEKVHFLFVMYGPI